MPDLVGVRAKLHRADVHLRHLNEAIESFLAGGTFRFDADEHEDERYIHQVIYIEVVRFPPDELWGPMIGDTVHNLRSA